MKEYNYPSEICEWCRCTDYGCVNVNTGYWNLCEGQGCEYAYIDWKEANPEDDRKLEELF